MKTIAPSVDDPSASYAAEIVRLLWPEPWAEPYVTRTRHRDRAVHRDAYLFPSERRPRLLVPAGVPGSASMLRRLGTGRAAIPSSVRGLVERSVGSRAFSLVGWPMLRVPGNDADADSIERHLAAVFGTPVRVGILLGPRRVNQKPVLQVFDLDGRLLGYAKIGHNDLTAELVRREAAALAEAGAASTRWFRVPRLIDHGRWGDLEILVVSPLVAGPGQPDVPRRARVNAMLELAGLRGITITPLGQSAFWEQLLDEVAQLSAEPDGPRLLGLAQAIHRHHADDSVHLGGWHGDWSRWNMNLRDGVVQLWDWERYDPDVPVAFDAIHFAAMAVRPLDGGMQAQEQTFLRAAWDGLHEMGVPLSRHDLTLRLYLLTVAVRYVDALRHGVTPALHRRTAWVLSLLEQRADHASPAPTGGRA